MNALIGIAVAALLWWLLKTFGRADPKALARLAKAAGGVVALGVAAVLMLRGRLDMAALAGGIGAWLLGWRDAAGLARPRPPATKAEGPRDRVPRPLGHDRDVARPWERVDLGSALAGRFAGRPFDGLDLPALALLREECLARDVEGAELVEAYLDRRFPGWREHAHRDPDGGSRAYAQRGAMTEQEAYEVLGLQPGEGADAIRAAHRSLMKKLHPDQGGSTYLASRVNQAKDVLLDRHR